MNQISRLKDM